MDMAEDTNYLGYDYNYEKLLNLSKEDWERIKLLSYYGYGYKNHTEEKWYPITQLLIWETIDKDAKFYYTKTYKGSKITKFTNETNELKKLVENHKKIPSFSNSYVKMSINSTLILDDSNKVLNEYEANHSEEFYYEIRCKDKDKAKFKKMADYKRAARTIYLNKACFNGLYRVNSKNEFNVPFNKKSKVNTYDGQNLGIIHSYLNFNEITIQNIDFEESVKNAKPGDFIYFDPPYDSDTSTFNLTLESLYLSNNSGVS